MDIVFVGAGRLATQFAQALVGVGHTVTAVYSRTLASARELCARVGGTPTNSIATLPCHGDAFIVAVKDDAIASLLSELAKGREGQTFFHTAGSVPLSVFEGTAISRYGVIYPMQTFSKERRVDFTRVPLFIEANDTDTLQLAHAIATSVSGDVRQLDSAKRRYLHLAAVLACNFSNHCYTLASQVLDTCGIPFSVMLPLIEETARKVQVMHPVDAQTGPAVRYDEHVIRSQSHLLAGQPMIREVYDLLSRSIHEVVEPEHPRDTSRPYDGTRP